MPSKLMMKKMEGSNVEVEIEIVDVSKTGIGFICKEPLQIGESYEVHLTIWTKEVIHTVLQISRAEIREEDFGYGAVFIGISPTDAARIEVYQTINDSEE